MINGETFDRLRGAADFPQAGEGISLQFRASDLGKLQQKFGDKWFIEAQDRFNRFDIEFLNECLKVGGKKDGKPCPIALDQVDATLAEVTSAVLDAMFISVHGKTFSEYLAWLGEQLNKFGGDSPLLAGPETSLLSSSEPPSGQA